MKTLIILGAGASYGAYRNSVNRSKNLSPPLTADLFSHVEFKKGTTRALVITNLIEQAGRIKKTDFDLEKSLAKLISDGGFEVELLDMRFALHNTIRNTSVSGFARIPQVPNLYEDLWYRVKDYVRKGNEVVILNMNYDTMLDAVIEKSEGRMTSFWQYLKADTWSLFHPHGSISWGYTLPAEWSMFKARQKLVNSNFAQNSPDLRLVHLRENFPTTSIPNGSNKYFFVPALALPVGGSIEKERFVSPEEHIEAMPKKLSNINNILIIGWRAMDQHIVELIVANKDSEFTRLDIVTASESESRDIERKLRQSGIIAIKSNCLGGGFENYVDSTIFNSLFPNPAL